MKIILQRLFQSAFVAPAPAHADADNGDFARNPLRTPGGIGAAVLIALGCWDIALIAFQLTGH